MTDRQKPLHWHTFLFALVIGIVIFLPFVIFDGGYFIYYGDFNVQQIPFYKLAHEAVRSGDIFWNWYTDLGVNFVGSYSFYLLFSPFFWLTLPFSTSFVPYLMAPLLVLKTACAALTAYFLVARFVRDRRYAMIGALLYAFSGWMDFNIFFNHFHEVAVFFPLLLLGMEQLVMDGKKGLFAVAVFVNAFVNYWFFIGEVVFVVLYFLVRLSDKGFRMRVSLSRFALIAFEAVLGVGCAAVAMLPSVLSLMGNPRTGADELVSGWNIWLYWHEQRQPAIIQSLFFPPELCARPNFLPDHGAKWASLSGWLPLLGMTGVIAYFFQRRHDWLKKLLALCLLFALVPGFNSMFILFNGSYYARWYYMPILLMCVASARALEDCAYDLGSFRRSIKWSAIVTVGFIVMSGLTPKVEDGELSIGLAEDSVLMWIYALIAVICLIMTALIVLKERQDKRFVPLLASGIAVISIAFTIFYMANGKNTYERSRYVINTAIQGREQIELPDDEFARSDAYDAMDNLLMFWHLPNIQTFHSVVPASIMEFYPAVGVKRDVASRPEAEYYALRPLLSVRWLFIEDSKEEQEPMPGYSMYDKQMGFNIYENDNFIPMGFAYDQFITREELEDFQISHRDNILLRAIVLEEDAWRRNQDILRPLEDHTFTASDRVLEEDCAARREYTVEHFRRDTRGFSAESSFETDQFIFFSVP
ncbi:YfhO family protein, partial [Ruminococcaceae bacterium OttesenSCG-928-L11]|nr:YfhO family protein [Ruminococcaceae bacterium OttesenSCG-928-L11]